MSGYSAMGINPAAIAPRRTMMIEITQARTGRSIKKRANIAVTRSQESGDRKQESGISRHYCSSQMKDQTGHWSLATGYYRQESITFHDSFSRWLAAPPTACYAIL